jgi:hypothetical protein
MSKYDIFNMELFVGDEVAFNPPVYKGLVIGTIVSFSDKQVRVSYKPTGKQTTTEASVYPRNVAKHRSMGFD